MKDSTTVTTQLYASNINTPMEVIESGGFTSENKLIALGLLPDEHARSQAKRNRFDRFLEYVQNRWRIIVAIGIGGLSLVVGIFLHYYLNVSRNHLF